MEANWEFPLVEEPEMVARYWRSYLQVESRQKMVDKIMDTLKRLFPLTSQEGMIQLNKMALKFEQNIYAVATSQADYIRKISLKVLTMEDRDHDIMRYFLPSNYASIGSRTPDPDRKPVTDAGDWRSQLQVDARQRIGNKTIDTLKMYLPFTSQEGLLEIKQIAVKIEEKIYTSATSLLDYLHNLSLHMLIMERKFQNIMGDLLPSNCASNSNSPFALAGESEIDAGYMRNQFLMGSRQRIVSKIIDSLKRHLCFSGQEGLMTLDKLAVKFEHKIYTGATSQPDYLRKISLMMLAMERNSKKSMGNYLSINSASSSSRALYPGGEPPMNAGDWKNQLHVNSRHRICNKIMDTLKRHLSFYGQEGLQKLKKIAVRFEQEIYTAATSKSDYLRKISLKMLVMDTHSRNTMSNSLPPETS